MGPPGIGRMRAHECGAGQAGEPRCPSGKGWGMVLGRNGNVHCDTTSSWPPSRAQAVYSCRVARGNPDDHEI
eukprot:3910007-Lingulodinium_polyedra.AAC.1